MKKTLMIIATVSVLVGSGAFYGGIKYAQSKSANLFANRQEFGNLSAEQRQQLGANIGGFQNGTGQGRSGMNGGFTAGEIISKDDKSITIKIADGGSKIVFYSNSTEINKFTDGTAGDLVVGKTVNINGSSNQDGSLTATSIQIRPTLLVP